MPSYIAKRFLIDGQVQGVGCRGQIYDLVESIGHLSGYVRNLPSGQVELCIKGPEWRINDLEKYLRLKLDPPVVVERILVEEWPESADYNGFIIRR